MNPECRHMETRVCPTLTPCPELCARFESDDPRPWTESRQGQKPHTA